MKLLLERFAAEYSVAEQKLSGRGDDQSSIHYPTVFLFIGDEAAEAMNPIMRLNELKWDNSDGVIYFHIASKHSDTTADLSDRHRPSLTRVVLDGLSSFTSENKKGRKELWQAFCNDNRHLLELNRALRQISDRIADYGRLYASFDRLHLAVITRVDDPMNVLVPELTLLAQSILQQSFKSIQMDMYALICEREQMETFAHASAIGVGFLRELDAMQHPNYTFAGPLQVTGDGLSIPVIHPPSPLFDLVYVLSDRNERGITAVNGMQDNYDIICHIQLLKNRKHKDTPANSDRESYNNSSFKNSLRTESGKQGFVSAGLAKVKRPNNSIALTVLYHFHNQLVLRLRQDPELDVKEKLAFFGLDSASMEARMEAIVPDVELIEDMTGILTSGARYEQLKRMTIREAEEQLYGNGCASFFQHHFVRLSEQRLNGANTLDELHRMVSQHMRDLPQIGFYQVAAWTDEMNEDESVYASVHAHIREMTRAIGIAREELEQLRNMRVEDLKTGRMPLMDKHKLRVFIRAFIDTVYRKQWLLLYLESELTLFRRIADDLVLLHEPYRLRVQQMNSLGEALQSASLQSIRMADDYTGQNIFEYYERVTDAVMKDIEDKRGSKVFFEDRYVGNITALLDQGNEKLAERLIDICRKYLLTSESFNLTFEEELLRRANVTIHYDNRKVLTKEELFHRLYRTLEDHSVINIRLLDYTHEHRYEEKYLFGDRDSEFIQYSLGVDESSRIYKLGCVYEKRSSGVERLNLMGGFHVEDLMYYRNGKVYYEAYQQNGYEFHGERMHALCNEK